MSWSDGPPRVLKKVETFSKVSFEEFEALPDGAANDVQVPLEQEFDVLAEPPEISDTFLAMTDHPDLARSKPGPSPADCSEALEIVRKTEEEMAALKEETRRQCALLEQEAYDKGFAAGEKDGIRAGEKKMQDLAEQLSAIIESLTGLRGQLVQQYESELLDLVLAVCRKIMYCEVSLNPRVIRETVRHILEDAPAGQPITLRLHPKDMEAVDGLISSDGVSATDMNRVTLKPDTSVSRGGCRMETPHGDMDAGIETRIKHVYDALNRAGAETAPGEGPTTHDG
jgi:flagellar assembly protein FliH